MGGAAQGLGERSVPAPHGSAPRGSFSARLGSSSRRESGDSPAHALSVLLHLGLSLPCVFTSFCSKLYPGRCFSYCLRRSA